MSSSTSTGVQWLNRSTISEVLHEIDDHCHWHLHRDVQAAVRSTRAAISGEDDLYSFQRSSFGVNQADSIQLFLGAKDGEHTCVMDQQAIVILKYKYFAQ